MIHHLPPPPRQGREYWHRVHRTGDCNPPIALPEPHYPFWAPEWELRHEHWLHRRPRALVALWVVLPLASIAMWAVILWAVGGL